MGIFDSISQFLRSDFGESLLQKLRGARRALANFIRCNFGYLQCNARKTKKKKKGIAMKNNSIIAAKSNTQNKQNKKNKQNCDFDAAQKSYERAAAVDDSFVFSQNPLAYLLRIFTFYCFDNARRAACGEFNLNGVQCHFANGVFFGKYESGKYKIHVHCRKRFLFEISEWHCGRELCEACKNQSGEPCECTPHGECKRNKNLDFIFKAAMLFFNRIANGGKVKITRRDFVEFCGKNRNFAGLLAAIMRFFACVRIECAKSACKKGRKKFDALTYKGALIKECVELKKGAIEFAVDGDLQALFGEFNFVKIARGVFALPPRLMRLALTVCFKFAGSRRRAFCRVSMAQCLKESFLSEGADNRHLKRQFAAFEKAMAACLQCTPFCVEYLPLKSVANGTRQKRDYFADFMRNGVLMIKTRIFDVMQKAKQAASDFTKDSVEFLKNYVEKRFALIMKGANGTPAIKKFQINIPRSTAHSPPQNSFHADCIALLKGEPPGVDDSMLLRDLMTIRANGDIFEKIKMAASGFLKGLRRFMKGGG